MLVSILPSTSCNERHGGRVITYKCYDSGYMNALKDRLVELLRWSERYTKTDMVYLASSSFWINAGTIFISLCSFLLYVVFGHFLPKETYGTYQYLLSIGAIVSAFTLTGMNLAVTRSAARGDDGVFGSAVRIQLLWNIVPTLVACGIGAWHLLEGQTLLGIGLFLIGIFVPLNSTLNTYSAFLAGKMDFRRVFTYSLWSNVPYYLSVGILAFFHSGALMLLAANLVSQAIGLTIAFRRTIARYRPPTQHREPVGRYGAQLSIANGISTITSQIDSLLTFYLLGPAALALYSFSTAIPDRLGIFKTIATAAFPKFANRSQEELRASFARKIMIGVLTTFVLASLYALFAPLIFSLFFPLYTEAVPYSQAYVFIVVVAFGSLFTAALTTGRRIKSLYVHTITSSVTQISLQVLGIIFFGLWGLIGGRIIATLFSSILGWVLVHLEARRPDPDANR